MSSSSPAHQRFVRQLLLVIVFLLGIVVVLLGDIANATSGFHSAVAGVSNLVGGITAVAALVLLYKSIQPFVEE